MFTNAFFPSYHGYIMNMALFAWLSLLLHSFRHCKMMAAQQRTSMGGSRARDAVQESAGAAEDPVGAVEVGMVGAEAANQAVMTNIVAVGAASGLAAMTGQDLLEVEAAWMIGQGAEDLPVQMMIGQGPNDLPVRPIPAEEEIGNHKLFFKVCWI